MSATRTILARYGVAAATSAAALAAAAALRPHHGGHLSPLILFYAAVAVSSWVGGTGPGLTATMLGAAAAAYFIFSPAYRLDVGAGDDRGRLVLFVCVGVLIAWLNGQLRSARQRYRAEAAQARRSEAKAKALTESNLIGVFCSDPEGKIEPDCCNDEFLRLIGRTREEVAAGRVNWRDMTLPEHRDRDERALDELRRCRVCAPFEKEYGVRNHGGRPVPVVMGCAMLDGSDDEVVGFVLDLTDRKRAEAAARAHEEKLRALTSELTLAEERERRRIATVLHDAVGQTLALAKLKVESMRQGVQSARQGPGDDAASARLGGSLAEVYGLIDYAVQHTRTLTNELSPPVLYELGLEAALQWLVDRARERHGLAADFDDDGQPKPVGPQVRAALFHAVRELLVNVAKHARATRCRVSVRRAGGRGGDGGGGGEIEIRVEDDGRGFDPPAEAAARGAATGDGFGLFNVRERLTRLGGRVEIDSRAGEGAQVTLAAPLAPAESGRPSAAGEDEPAAEPASVES